MSLTPDAARLSAVRSRSYRLSDGDGLYLEVSPSGGRWWRFRYRFNQKANTVSCGIFPDVSVEEARVRRDSFRAMLVNGVNPSEHAKTERAAKQMEQARQQAAIRFTLDSDGALSFCLGARRLSLTPAETVELRSFLDATRSVVIKGVDNGLV